MLRNINKVKLIMPILITVGLLVLLFLTLLAEVNYSIQDVNWGDFLFSIFYWVSGRVTYFPLGVELGEQNQEVKLLENTISKYRREIFKTKTNKLVDEKFKFKNTLAKTSAYINKLDVKINKLSDKTSKLSKKKLDKLYKKRELAIEFLDKFEKKEPYRGKFNINNVHVKYDILDFGTCFSYGNDQRRVGHKFKINVNSEGAIKSFPSFMFSTVFSFMSACVSILTYGFTWMALFTFIMKMILLLLGCYNGVTLGKDVIEHDKYNVLLNITEAVKEIITEVEDENNIVIDTQE